MTPAATTAYDVVLAHHGLAVALPFFVPALLVVVAVGAVVWRDRHAPPDDAPRPGPDADEPGDPDAALQRRVERARRDLGVAHDRSDGAGPPR